MAAEIYEGAAGLGVMTGYEGAYGGGPVPFGDLAPPPGGRPPTGPSSAGQAIMAPPQYGAPPSEATQGMFSTENLVKLVILAGGAYLAYTHFFKKSPEEMAANDEDDGSDYEKNSRSGFMSPYSRNGSDDDDDDDDDEDEDEDEDDEDEEDEGEDFAMNAKNAGLTPNSSSSIPFSTAHRARTARILAELEAVQKRNGG